jgi:hypothetical protein
MWRFSCQEAAWALQTCRGQSCWLVGAPAQQQQQQRWRGSDVSRQHGHFGLVGVKVAGTQVEPA